LHDHYQPPVVFLNDNPLPRMKEQTEQYFLLQIYVKSYSVRR